MAAAQVSGQALERAFAGKQFKLEAAQLASALNIAQKAHLGAEALANQYETLALVKCGRGRVLWAWGPGTWLAGRMVQVHGFLEGGHVAVCGEGLGRTADKGVALA